MTYPNWSAGRFLARPNRFVAHVEMEGRVEVCHVKNTGRCRELLVPGARVYLTRSDNPSRKTRYDLIAVEKGTRLINMDSQAPNHVFAEWARRGGIPGVTLLRPECRHGDSRFDFYLEAATGPMFAEVKGVTLERDGTAMFPDAPTQRGAKHLRELCRCVGEGYAACAAFVIQMRGVKRLVPNVEADPDFARALAEARDAGVRLVAFDCAVTPGGLEAGDPVEIALD